MKRRLLLILPSLQQLDNYPFRLIKYSRFPPLSLLTIAGMTPEDKWDIMVRDEHIESSEVQGHVDLVGIQTYISCAGRAYALAAYWRARGAKVVLGGLHPTSLPHEAIQHADAICTGPVETVWHEVLDDFERGQLKGIYQGKCEGSAALVPLPRRDLINPYSYLIRNTMVTSRGCPHSCDFCYKSSFWGPKYYEARPITEIERELETVEDGMVFFLDDNLLANRKHAHALFDVLRGSGIVWQAAASLDVTRDPGYLDQAYEAGCRSLFVGFESISPENNAFGHCEQCCDEAISIANRKLTSVIPAKAPNPQKKGGSTKINLVRLWCRTVKSMLFDCVNWKCQINGPMV